MTITTLTLFTFDTHKLDSNRHYITSEIQHGGKLKKLEVYFSEREDEEQALASAQLIVTGKLMEDTEFHNLTLTNARITEIPPDVDWVSFLIRHFITCNAVIEQEIFSKDITLNFTANNVYVWCSIDESRCLLNKLEFGRHLPLIGNDKHQMTNWTKGVFRKDKKPNVEYLQTSWDGEEGEQYKLVYNESSKILLTNILQIPCEIGWIEEDYRLDNDKYYKVKATIELKDKTYSWSFTLQDIGEQDIPFFFDKFEQLIRTKDADSFWNNKRRHIDKIHVQPMKLTTTNTIEAL